MRQKRITRLGCPGLLLVLAVMSVGCKSSQATPTAVSKSLGDIYASQALDTSYAGALNAYRQLMLGTIRLEGTENAVTLEQAQTLLILWQSLQGRALQSDAEREAVLAYIEKQMTPMQIKAIAAMRLTQADLQAPITDTGQGPGGGFGRGMPQTGAGQLDAAGTPFAPGERVTPQAMITRQAQSGRVTSQAGGTSRGTSGGVGIGSGQDTVLLNALIRLLAQKSAGSAASPMSSRTPNRTPAPRSLPSPTPVPTSLPSPTPTKP